MTAHSHISAPMPHIAIIMDGNGRWAQAKHRPRLFGHRAGVKTVRRVVEDARDIGVKCLTLYSFSTENWNRPRTEIRALFDLLKRYVEDDLEALHKNGVRVRIVGSQTGLPDDILTVINHVETRTRENTEFSLNIAFNYGGRDEILRACRTAMKTGIAPDELDEAKFDQLLDTADLPPPDLVIRTSGEYRISNFLLWQAAYAEFVFTDVLWPDFTKDDLEAALKDYFSRNRRFGGVKAVDVA